MTLSTAERSTDDVVKEILGNAYARIIMPSSTEHFVGKY